MSNLDKLYKKVFISYAEEDIDEANKIYNYLENNRYNPWLDKKKLLGGQYWDYHVGKALKEADFIILLLSDISVKKRGYVQKEYKLALEYCEYKLDSDIYIIPCKLNDCLVPDKLSKYQWIELDNPNGFESILNSLNYQRTTYLNEKMQNSIMNTPLEYTEITVNRVVEKTPECDIELIYPQFTDTKNEDLFLLNSYIQFYALSEYSDIIQINQDNEQNSLSSLYVGYNFESLTNSIISWVFYVDSYIGGAAHPNYRRIAHNFTLNPLSKLTIQRLFDCRDDALTTLYNICYERLVDEALEREIIESRDESFMFDSSFVPEWHIFENFYLEGKLLKIIFNPYELTAYALGHFTVEINSDELLKIHPDLGTLKEVLQPKLS